MRYGNKVYWAELPDGNSPAAIDIWYHSSRNDIICRTSSKLNAIHIIDALMFLYRIKTTSNAYVTEK